MPDISSSSEWDAFCTQSKYNVNNTALILYIAGLLQM